MVTADAGGSTAVFIRSATTRLNVIDRPAAAYRLDYLTFSIIFLTQASYIAEMVVVVAVRKLSQRPLVRERKSRRQRC
jgi:hypothetical protein